LIFDARNREAGNGGVWGDVKSRRTEARKSRERKGEKKERGRGDSHPEIGDDDIAIRIFSPV
jgi:hypothetical protein